MPSAVPVSSPRGRGLTRVRLLLVLLALLTLGLTPVTSADAAPASGTPLAIRLTGLSPAVVPTHGRLVVTGTVTNRSNQQWRDINIHAFASTVPLTTRAEVAAAAKSPIDAAVGNRWDSPHAFEGVGNLAPGESAKFRLSIPRSDLIIPRNKPGVYWFGVHALGTSPQGRDLTADGRARTFLAEPTAKAAARPATVSVVLPFRAAVRRDAEGRLRRPADWVRLLTGGGRLNRLLRLAESAPGDSVNLVVDPAVLDAIATVAYGPTDPAAPTATNQGTGTTTASPSPTESPSSTPSGQPTPSASPRPSKGVSAVQAARAAAYLTALVRTTGNQRTFATGYGDPDVAAMAASAPYLLQKSRTLAFATTAKYGINAAPVVAPVDGYLTDADLTATDSRSTVILGDHGHPKKRSQWRSGLGQTLLIGSDSVAAGGPSPGPRTDLLAMRQRILAEASLMTGSRSSGPLVVVLPDGWNPGPDWRNSDFFGTLQQPWLQLSGIGDSSPIDPIRQQLRVPAAARAHVLPTSVVAATRSVAQHARVFANALANPVGVNDAFDKVALQFPSYHSRGSAPSAEVGARALATDVTMRLDGVRVEGSDPVTLSGSGTFVVTLVNDLDVSVKVTLRASHLAQGLRLTMPDTITIPAHRRATVPVRAHASGAIVEQVVLSAATDKGARIGTPLQFTVRNSQAGTFIWLVMGAGGLLLVGMIARRLLRRGFRTRSPAQ